MKHHVLSKGFIVFSLIVYVIHGENKNLSAVSKFEGLDQLHIRVRNIRLDSNNMKYLLEKPKNRHLCMEIFSSAHFIRLGITVKFYRYLPYWNISKTKIIHVYNHAIEDTVAECVFVCRCESASSGRAVVKYFVSGQYNVSDTLAQYVAGRFIFTRQRDTFYYEALAEEPANIVAKNVEKLYLQAKEDDQIASTDSDDPLCKLDVRRKLRICNLILNSSYFVANKFRFSGNLDHVYDKCHRRQIIFRADSSKEKVKKKNYEEWMMSCQAMKRSSANHFYLSRAYESHKVFVYSSESGSNIIFLEILATDVRDIIDETVGNENRPTTSNYGNAST